MPTLRQPKIRRKNTGLYFVRWGGRDRSLSTDLPTARRLFADPAHPHSLHAWKAWRLSAEPAPPRRTAHALSIAELASRFLAAQTSMAKDYRGSLSRWLNLHGRASVLELSTPDPAHGRFQAPAVPLLIALREDLRRMGLAPATINHDLQAVKRLFNWGAEHGLCASIAWRACKRLPEPPPEPRDLTIAGLRLILRVIRHQDPALADALSINYLTLCRPSDTPVIIRAFHELTTLSTSTLATFVPITDERGRVLASRGMLRLTQHKTRSRGHERHVLVTDECLEILARCAPRWTRLDSYSHAAAKAGLHPGPQVMRDSAASHLLSLGVAQADVSRLLGHAPRGVLHSYARPAWHVLRQKAALLTLR